MRSAHGSGSRGVGDAVAVLGCVQGDDADAEVADEPSGEGQHVGDTLVLRAAVPDQHGGVRAGCALGQPVDARHRLARDLEVEPALDDAQLGRLVHDLHGWELGTAA